MQVLAEKAAWDLAKESGIDLVTIHLSVVLGPLTSRRGGFFAEIVKVRVSYLSALQYEQTLSFSLGGGVLCVCKWVWGGGGVQG